MNKHIVRSKNSVINASGRYMNAGGPYQAPSPMSGKTWQNATGGNGAMSVSNAGGATSTPYIITLTNASVGNVSNFQFMWPNQYLSPQYSSSWNSDGSLTIGSVTVSTSFGSYSQLLSQLKTSPFIIGQTDVVYTSGSAATLQLQTPLIWGWTDASGAGSTAPIIPRLSNNQFQTSQISNYQTYAVTDKIYLQTTLQASSSISVYLYPAQVLDPANSLGGYAMQQQFVSPQNNVVPTVVR